MALQTRYKLSEASPKTNDLSLQVSQTAADQARDEYITAEALAFERENDLMSSLFITGHRVCEDENGKQFRMTCTTEHGLLIEVPELLLQEHLPSAIYTYWHGADGRWERPLFEQSGVEDRFVQIIDHRFDGRLLQCLVQWAGYPAFEPHATWELGKFVKDHWPKLLLDYCSLRDIVC